MDVAIHSLVERMRQALRTEVRYGIFRCFLGSLLLWKGKENRLSKISYEGRTVPSWSWMAYSGGVDFIADVRQDLMIPRVVELGFTDDGKALKVQVRQFGGNCRMERQGEGYAIVNGTWRVGFVWFDVEVRVELKHCVVVGMGKGEMEELQKTYYVIIVRDKEEGGERYERLGVGKVRARYVSIDCEAGTLW